MDKAVTVTKLNQYIKSIIERNPNLTDLLVCGEISNFKLHSSGHMYLSLKDENSLVRAVMFRGNASKLKFMPENGMKVIVRCKVSVYERDGQYQLYLDDMMPDGIGALNLAFEQLKEKLQNEGLFRENRKKSIPKYPERVGVITSPTGAAVRDIVNVLTRRYPLARVIFAPVLVQGDAAPASIIDAIQRFNRIHGADVLIVGRGGGSIEELWAFNDEGVARTVAASAIPVISAVGHETDFTICDFVADLRAPTPSAAAELAVPNRTDLLRQVASMQDIMRITLHRRLQSERNRLNSMTTKNVLQSPASMLYERQLLLDSYVTAMMNHMRDRLSKYRMRFSTNCAKLDMLSPLKVLSRGYAIPFLEDKVIKGIETVKIDDTIHIRLLDGGLDCRVTGKVPNAKNATESA